jgi:quaternary ammonium compound-resistance protein SugE
MAWMLVCIAGVLEVGFALSLKASDGFSKPLPSVLFVIFMIGSLALLNLGLRTLPVGAAYAVWTGIGAAGTAVLGMMFLNEPVQVVRLASIAAIVAGVVGLQLTVGQS